MKAYRSMPVASVYPVESKQQLHFAAILKVSGVRIN